MQASTFDINSPSNLWEYLQRLFSPDFMPHGHCYFWRPDILWTNVIADFFIAVAYVIIPIGLIYFIKKRKDMPFSWIFVLFGLFIVSCGMTHVMEIWTVWHGAYRLSGLVKVVTAAASIGTAIAIWPLIPKALAIPSRAEVQAANAREQAVIQKANAELEEKVKERTASLLQSNIELEQFAYIASHDLQEPLRKISSFAERLNDTASEKLTGAEKEHLEKMESAAGRMRRVIEDLLQFSKMNNKEMAFEKIDLNKVLNELGQDLDLKITESGCRLEMGKLPVVKANETQMKHLFQNLILNSIKFSRKEESPRIDVDCVLDGDYVRIRVRDNGIGFKQQYAGKIFQPFQRLHGKDEYEGTGIGLAICEKIVQNHGGRITAQSELGKGALFTIFLPAIPNG